MAQYDVVIPYGYNRAMLCERQDDGGYKYVPLNIFSDAKATVTREDPNGDVWVIFHEYPFRDFVFKREELLYVLPSP